MKCYYIPLPDNENQFFAFVTLVINNRCDRHIEWDCRRPKQIGPVKVNYTRNEVGENYVVVRDQKEENFVNMILNQFTQLRTYWDELKEYEEYPNASKF